MFNFVHTTCILYKTLKYEFVCVFEFIYYTCHTIILLGILKQNTLNNKYHIFEECYVLHVLIVTLMSRSVDLFLTQLHVANWCFRSLGVSKKSNCARTVKTWETWWYPFALKIARENTIEDKRMLLGSNVPCRFIYKFTIVHITFQVDNQQ